MAINRAVATPTTSSVCRRGPYVLERLSENTFVLTGPDPAFDREWLMGQLGHGDWMTRWVPSEVWSMLIFR